MLALLGSLPPSFSQASSGSVRGEPTQPAGGTGVVGRFAELVKAW